ncbi:MAG: hypothetical protein FJ009_21600 [Chloroflexi bacterium]|nr:hypothetical protein [Chloroflexota bacterium]
MSLRLSALLILGALFCLALSASACEYFESPGGITKAVTAQSAHGATFEPINVTDNFAPDQNEFHVIVTLTNAPKNSTVKVVWTAIDVGSALSPNTKIDQTEVTTDGSRNLDFTLKRKSAQWAPGLYKAEIFWNDKLDRTLNFIVVGTPQKTNTVVASKCPPATTQPHKPTGLLAQVIMAEGVGANNEPVNRTGEFLPSEVIYASVSITNAPANTKFRAVFYAVDAGAGAQCNVKLGESEQIASGSKNLAFKLQQSKDWLLGTYRVDIYVNDVLDHTANFVVVTKKQVH